MPPKAVVEAWWRLEPSCTCGPHADLYRHQIAFLLATKSLSALARVRNDENWVELLHETEACHHRRTLLLAGG